MANNLATPGVYVKEQNAFPSSVVAIPTAVPAFIGYTEKTNHNGMSLVNKPVRITSFAEFYDIFGGSALTKFKIQESASASEFDFVVGGKNYQIVFNNPSRFILFDSVRLFFANGGGSCFIVSAGSYYAAAAPTPLPGTPAKDEKGKPVVKPATSAASNAPKVNTIAKSALEAALSSLVSEDEPTMVLIPEAVMLEKADCFALQQTILQHCGYVMKDRFAILDVYEGYKPRTIGNDVVATFREGVGNNNLSFGAAYYPWVYTSIVQNEEISFQNIADVSVLEDILTKETQESTSDSKRAEEIKAEIKKLKAPADAKALNQTLKVVSPVFKKILDKIRTLLNVLPPSAGMAGIYSTVDNTRGVWKAPANVGYSSVISPVIKITNQDQEELNVTVSGKSVNAIRPFIGEGTVVWGARTLDGNSQDWRYINVRRTLLFIEQSIKNAAKTYVFEPNTAATWVLMRSMINTFLNNLWKQGGLVGSTPDQAYEVQVGLGSTMTSDDILDGVMRITVKVAVSRPAEFIVITFQQKVQES